MRRTRFLVALVSALPLALVGCDLLCPVSQEVTLGVIQNLTGETMVDAVVTFARAPRGFRFPPLSNEEYLNQFGDERGIDPSGQVVFSEETFIICGGGIVPFFYTPPTYPDTLPDYVTGEEYLVRIETETGSEILTIELTLGNTVAGEFFEVTVVSIGEPVPVEDSD